MPKDTRNGRERRCRRKHNGKRQRAGRTGGFSLGGMIGMRAKVAVAYGPIIRENPAWWVVSRQARVRMVVWIWRGMCISGALIIMIPITTINRLKVILPDLKQEIRAWCAAVFGTTSITRTAARPTGSATMLFLDACLTGSVASCVSQAPLFHVISYPYSPLASAGSTGARENGLARQQLAVSSEYGRNAASKSPT